jgi:hypothetical protein
VVSTVEFFVDIRENFSETCLELFDGEWWWFGTTGVEFVSERDDVLGEVSAGFSSVDLFAGISIDTDGFATRRALPVEHGIARIVATSIDPFTTVRTHC